jgi:uncharacterized protein (DUF58 family)
LNSDEPFEFQNLELKIQNFMTRYRVVWVLFLVALAGALSTQRGLFWAFAGALFMLIIIPILWAWTGVNWLRIRRRTFSKVAQAGQILEEEFQLANLSAIPKLWVEVRDHSSLPGHAASRVMGMLGGNQWRGWRVRTRCTERGRYALGPITVKSGDPLGIYDRERRLNNVNTLLVYPATYPLQGFPLPPTFMPGGEALRRRTHYVTTNAAGVRDYVAGDSINRIHWPTSVRRQRLIVKEFELDPMSDLWIVVDLHAGSHVSPLPLEPHAEVAQVPPANADGDDAPFQLPAETEEYAISIAASVAEHFLLQDRLVGLVAYGRHREVISAERGERQRTKIMETLAVIRAEGAVPFDRVLQSEVMYLPRGSTVVMISASPDVAWTAHVQRVARSGLRVVAIVIDRASFGSDIGSEEVLAALGHSGAVVRIVRYGDAIPEAVGH